MTEKRILFIYASTNVPRFRPGDTIKGYYVSTFLERDGEYVDESEMPIGDSCEIEAAIDIAVMATNLGWIVEGAPKPYDEVRFEGLEITPVRAECHSNDFAFEYNFDASPWFEQAAAKQIVDLGNCGWGGDYPADAVALWMAYHDDRLGMLFTYLELAAKSHTVGFECHVDEGDAAHWLAINRPQLLAEIEGVE